MNDMKHLLVPVDFSFYANKAVDFAVQSAKLFPAEITLLYVYDGGSSDPADFLAITTPIQDELYEDAATKLNQLKVSISETENIAVNTVIKAGSVEDIILEIASLHNISIIIMGTVGASGMKEKLWGTKTSSVIGRSSIPVLAIPWNYTWELPKKWLLATNHFNVDDKAKDLFFEIAAFYTGDIYVAVFSDEDSADAITYMENERNIQLYRERMLKKYADYKLNAVHLSGKNFEDSLQNYIDRENIGILGMITYHKTFWERFFNPSMTKRMAYHTTIPLLSLPADQ